MLLLKVAHRCRTVKSVPLLFVFSGALTFGQQSWSEFTGEEKAFFYRVSRETALLRPELFHLFVFTDTLPLLNDTLVDYDSVERAVVRDSSLLEIHRPQFARKSTGLISDLACRFALWELNNMLNVNYSEDTVHHHFRSKWKAFEHRVAAALPQIAFIKNNLGEYVVSTAVKRYFGSTLQPVDQLAALSGSGFGQNDQLLILNAIGYARERYVDERSKEVVSILGGHDEGYRDLLSAVGGGGGDVPLEGRIATPYHQKLPDERRLFRFHVVRRTAAEKHLPKTEQKRTPQSDAHYLEIARVHEETVSTRPDLSTVVHVDVQGVHPERQTTVVMERGEAAYLLYGNDKNRRVSPDSSYGKGATYHRLLWELEHVHIAAMNELIHGKRSYTYRIKFLEKEIKSTLLAIKETEYRLDELRHRPEGKPKMKKKKRKRNTGISYQPSGHPLSAPSKKDKQLNKQRNQLLRLNAQLTAEKRLLNQLKEEMERAYFTLERYLYLRDRLQKQLGREIMSYVSEGDCYTFSDGATFNWATQDMTFPKDEKEEPIKIRHITFGKSVFDPSIAPSLVHFNISHSFEGQRYIHKKVVDHFVDSLEATSSDSLQIMELFRILSKEDRPLEMHLLAGGILGECDGIYFRDTSVTAAVQRDSILPQNAWEYRATKADKVYLRVEVWRDRSIPPDFHRYQKKFARLKERHPNLNEIDYLTAVQARQLAIQWKKQLIEWASLWLEKSPERARILQQLSRIKPSKVGFENARYWEKVAALSGKKQPDKAPSIR